MASQFSRLRRAAVPLGALSAAAVLTAPPAYAQEGKKPIYDAPPPAEPVPAFSTPTRPTPTDRLAEQIGIARRFINVHYRLGRERFDEAFSTYLSYETAVTSTIAGLAPPRESGELVLPGTIYVAVTTMAGAIATRNRMWPVRALTPLAVGVAAGWYFIPETMTNMGELMWYYEKKVPVVAENHLQARKSILETLEMTRQKTAEAKAFVDVHVSQGRKIVEDLVRRG